MKKADNYRFEVIAFCAQGSGISGGDRIMIEFSKRWSKLVKNFTIHTTYSGYKMGLNNSVDKNLYKVHSLFNVKDNPYLLEYLARILRGVLFGFSYNSDNTLAKTIVYSSSEFLMDVIPAFIIKLKHINVVWVATWFQTAPNPIRGYAEGKRDGDKYRFRALLYWMSQQLTKPMVSGLADLVLVNNESEKGRFKNSHVVLGAVNPPAKVSKKVAKAKKYDGVFQGRLHAQKGAIELVHIWSRVVSKIPDAKLAVIGDGPLMIKVKEEIKKLKLQKNIELLGYVFDGNFKESIFKNSKVVLHPALFDSGGMASAEAMIYGNPVVGFDLDSYKSYYPEGMIKVEVGNLDKFASKVVGLVRNKSLRDKIGKKGSDWLLKNSTWDIRSSEVYKRISKI